MLTFRVGEGATTITQVPVCRDPYINSDRFGPLRRQRLLRLRGHPDGRQAGASDRARRLATNLIIKLEPPPQWERLGGVKSYRSPNDVHVSKLKPGLYIASPTRDGKSSKSGIWRLSACAQTSENGDIGLFESPEKLCWPQLSAKT